MKFQEVDVSFFPLFLFHPYPQRLADCVYTFRVGLLHCWLTHMTTIFTNIVSG